MGTNASKLISERVSAIRVTHGRIFGSITVSAKTRPVAMKSNRTIGMSAWGMRIALPIALTRIRMMPRIAPIRTSTRERKDRVESRRATPPQMRRSSE